MRKIEIKKTNHLIKYESAFTQMQERVKKIALGESNELLWFLEHDHIYTQGTSATTSEIIKKNQIEIIKTNRGGKTTYHGPGQRIVYFLINLNDREKDIRSFISLIENTLISLLADYKIEAKSFRDRVGIWVIKSDNITFDKEKKIGAIGLRISKWITYHGLSFNINPDLIYYKYIHSCGLKDYKNTSLKELNINISKEEFDYNFEKKFIYNLSKL